MSYKAIYTYAWDLAEDGVANCVTDFQRLGLDTVTIAGSYHAGKFLRPHGKTGKVFFPEDGTAYFHTDPARYGAIKPIANSLLADQDVLGELTSQDRMAVNVWLVLLHNTQLGMAHPDAVVRNAFGDPYYYNLCPSAPEARGYAIGLARDVTESYPVAGISMEAPGFTPYAHGYHHEFALMRSNAWLENLLGLCFCEHCVAAAEAQGIDARRLKVQVAHDIETYLDSDIDFPPDMAEAFWRADIVADGDLRRYLDFRTTVVTTLVAEIRGAVRAGANVAVIPSVARPTGGAWYEGSDLRALGATAGIIEACFYEPSPMRVKADLFDVRRRIDPDTKLRGILRPSFPDLATAGEFNAAVAALREGGVKELAFYNYGHLRRANLEWIGAALGGTA
jgi:nitroreductase